MPATSKAQQKAAGAALSAKRGETKKSELKGASQGNVQIHERKAARGIRRDQAQRTAGKEVERLSAAVRDTPAQTEKARGRTAGLVLQSPGK